MKKIYIMSLLGACIASVLFCSSVALASDDFRLYVEGEVGGSFADFDSGGWNAEPFKNTSGGTDESIITGVHFGAELFEYLRADIGFSYRDDLDFTTNGYPLSPNSYYKTKIEDTYTLMFSLYFEPLRFEKFTPYIGAGIGSTWTKISTNDTVVKGSRDKAIFSWQAEAGIQYDLTQHLTLKLGYRYIDLGNLEIHLRSVEDGTHYGKYRGELTANEVILGIRYSF
jgi:opacity protein-like surface antigen